MPQLQEQVSLRPYHTFGLDVQARWLFAVHSEEEALEFLADNRWSQHPLLILGGGSNILFRGDVEGIVLLNRIKGIEVIEETDTDVRVRVGAGEPWHPFVLHCLDQGWYGIENLSLIPGTVGAAPIQNIGAYGVEIKEFFDHLEAMHLSTLQVRKFGKTDCAFGYRDSFFKQEGKGKYLITRVCFRLSKVPKPNLSYAALTEEIGTDPTHITPRMVSDAVIRVRQSKLPDPAVIGNAGSFFKNPEIPFPLFEQIKAAYPQVPSYPVNETTVKVPAGWLIQTVGFKGIRRGEYGVHDKQALVLVNHGGAKGQDIVDLSTEIIAKIQETFGIELEREVQIV